jgi:hypothetical protein
MMRRERRAKRKFETRKDNFLKFSTKKRKVNTLYWSARAAVKLPLPRHHWQETAGKVEEVL